MTRDGAAGAERETAVAPLVVPSLPQSVGEIRRYAVDVCRGDWCDDCDVLALLVSEVATNALVHGSGQVEVRVLTSGPRLRVEVADGSAHLPVVRTPSRAAEGGRGLALVSALSDGWGAEPKPDGTGKTVWFELGGGRRRA